MNGNSTNLLEPAFEKVGIDPSFNWTLPLRVAKAPTKKINSVWYMALPISSAHRGGHSGGGALIEGIGGQERYANEGTAYPHAALVEQITYHQMCFPETAARYVDLSHENWEDLSRQIREDPPDVAAITVYTATAIWAYVVAAEIKKANPNSIIVLGNDHASLLHEEILQGKFGSRLVDFIGMANNGPFTLMGIIYALRGQLEWERVPSLAYRHNGGIKYQNADTYPLTHRVLPDYGLIEDYLAENYDQAFRLWYSQHYELQRMVTLPLDGGCNWGKEPSRRCKHCSIVGLTPKTAAISKVIPTLEHAVGQLRANVYAAGDSTLGFSSNQWKGESTYLDELAVACANSPVLKNHRFMLAYGLVREFINSAELCKGFVRTWNVGIESFDAKILKNNSKGVNKNQDLIYQALELARTLDYRMHASGILGLPGTTLEILKREVDSWLTFAEVYQENITTISVALPAIIPGSKMYWESYQQIPEVRRWHGELIPTRKLTELYLEKFTHITIADAESALRDVARGILTIAQKGNPVKFGGYMFGGVDEQETRERTMLSNILGDIS